MVPELQAWIQDRLRQVPWTDDVTRSWLTALAIGVSVAAALWLLRVAMAWRVRVHLHRQHGPLTDLAAVLLRRTYTWFLLVLAAYCGSQALALSQKVDASVQSIVILASLVQGAFWADALLDFAIAYQGRRRTPVDAAALTTLAALGFLGRVTIWTVTLLLLLANQGVNVTAMIAGLGIGGVAVALAAQNILGDLFASASIVLDRPFVLGDSIAVGDDKGTVEHIGLKTTRVRSVDGEQLVFSNADLLKCRIRNYRPMTERRSRFTLGVSYQTPPDKLEQIPAMIREAIQAQSPVRFEAARWTRYGDFALEFEVIYFVLSGDAGKAADIQHAVNLAILRRFHAEGIQFAHSAPAFSVPPPSVPQ